MLFDPKTYRQAIGQFATGVTVIATEVEGDAHGMTANSVTSVSLEPPLLLFCVDRRAKLAELLQPGVGFSVNILREDQEALSSYFAGSWKEAAPPPFRFVRWEHSPRLEGSAAALDCVVHEILPGGDHWIVLGEVRALYRGLEPRRPLLYFGGQYQRVDFSAAEPAPDLDPATEVLAQIFYDPWEGESG